MGLPDARRTASAPRSTRPPAPSPPKITYVYRSSDPTKHGFDAYDPANPPSDVATTTTDQGRKVPFVVRVETGVMDRGIYSIAILADPPEPWQPWAPQPGWNGKVLWPFGGDCKPYHAQDPPVDPLGGLRLDQPGADTTDLGVDLVGGSIYGNGNATAALATRLRGRRQRATTSTAPSATAWSAPRRS